MTQNLLLTIGVFTGIGTICAIYLFVYLPRKIKREKADIVFFLDIAKKYSLANNNDMLEKIINEFGERCICYLPESFRNLGKVACENIANDLIEYEQKRINPNLCFSYPHTSGYDDEGLLYYFSSLSEDNSLSAEELCKEKIIQHLREAIA